MFSRPSVFKMLVVYMCVLTLLVNQENQHPDNIDHFYGVKLYQSESAVCIESNETDYYQSFFEPDYFQSFFEPDDKLSYSYELAINSKLNIYSIFYYHIRYTRRVKWKPIQLRHGVKLFLLVLSGDIALNPGPVRFPCESCRKPVARTHRKLYCESCCDWWHIKCANISPKDYLKLLGANWTCQQCENFHFSDSFFSDHPDIDTSFNSETEPSPTNETHIFDELYKCRKKDPHKFICAYLNINSMRNKFDQLKELLTRNIVDILFIAETKLDSSFVDSQFQVDNYHFWRADRTDKGGGVAAFLRSDIPGDRQPQYEFTDIESISIEVIINQTKWLFIGAYKPPILTDEHFQQDCDTVLDKVSAKYKNYVLTGDLNCDMLDVNKCKPIQHICDIFDLSNTVNKPTCYASVHKPSLLDLILTNNTSVIHKTLNFNCGLSDVHNIIGFQLTCTVPIFRNKWISYRSFKHFNAHDFNDDLETEFTHFTSDEFEMNDLYQNFNDRFLKIIDIHAPMKKKKLLPSPVPYMNKTLKHAIYKKKMLANKFDKCKTSRNWENFRKQRNLVTKLQRKSINKYFIDRCTGGCKSKDFWPTVKPFLSKKANQVQKNTVLLENGTLVNNQNEVCQIFNDFFVNVAKDIGTDSIPVNENHPSIVKIKNNHSSENKLVFKPVSVDFVGRQIDALNVRKATGHDKISAKILKAAKPAIATHITTLINHSFLTSTFPHSLKIAQVTPIHKKNSTLEKGNYRPVSILPVISKLFERAMNTHLTNFFEPHFNIYLSAFRSGYGCQSTILKVVEDWKKALDENKYVAAILMDLSKAFDCLPHNLLLLKLKHYGVSDAALDLLNSYLCNRKQCIKLGSCLSTMQDIQKGVPQGSILGPVLFNIFINDIFYFVQGSNLYNYADDNTVSYSSSCLSDLKANIENDSLSLIEWFSHNRMKANPEKFQAISIGNKTKKQNLTFNLDGNTISCDDEVKLLGVTLDFRLKFDRHVSEISRKASRQLNALKRIGKHLCKLGRLTIYHSFILSNFNYCPLTWHFCGVTLTNKMEKIQERALRFVYNDYESNYVSLLAKSKMPTLKIRRMKTMAEETFKILHNKGPIYLHDLVSFKANSKYSFRYTNLAELPKVRTTGYGLNSFRYSAPSLWNSLPQHFRETTNFNHFKSLISSWDGKNCTCTSCRA